MDERRREPRVEIDWPVEIFLNDGTIEGIAKNITPKGLFVCCEEPLSLKENYRVSIFTPNNKALTVVGKAVWSNSYAMDDQNAPVCIGLSFIKISPEDRNSLKKMIQKNTKE
jgi:hypothetical protein